MVYDYIVVGAGPAGCICARELKKINYSVCVLEKQSVNYRKVCGDGISHACVQTLKSINFPIEDFVNAGAVKIKRYIHYVDGRIYQDRIEEHNKEAYGLARNKIDSVFRQYCTKGLDLGIRYNMNVKEIKSKKQGYEVCGIRTKKIILATGASARIKIDGNDLISPDADSPVGISAILHSNTSEIPFFMFDYKEEYKGTYGWIFSVGEREYNVGLWLKTDKDSLRTKFNQFMETRVKEYFGDNYQLIRKPRGAIMGIGNKRADYNDSVIYIGDASNSSNPENGEGISLAIKDALDFVDQIQ